jgi:hypothetical protein
MWRFIVNHRFWFISGGIVFVLAAWWGGSPTENSNKPALVKSEAITEGKAVTPDEIPADQLYRQALKAVEDRDLLAAKEFYQRIYREHPDFEQIQTVQAELEKINMDILFSNIPAPETVSHEVISGDTLGKLAKQYGTTIDLIKIKNNLKSDVIRIGQKLRIWTAPFNIFVDKSQNILMVKKDNEVLKVYHVSTGKGSSTPAGEFTITSRLPDPVWFNRGVVVPPDSPANVLGTRWLGFDVSSYGIHGTVNPDTIGQQVTEGCVRMRNEEVEELYSFIPTGTKVVIID